MNPDPGKEVVVFPMSLKEYQAVLRRTTRVFMVVAFGLMLAGQAGGIYLAYRIVAWSSWGKGSWQVPLVMFPLVIAPILIAVVIGVRVDKRIGLKCECGQSLTLGPHTARLMREGGSCPRCGRIVVEDENEEADD